MNSPSFVTSTAIAASMELPDDIKGNKGLVVQGDSGIRQP